MNECLKEATVQSHVEWLPVLGDVLSFGKHGKTISLPPCLRA